MAPEDMWRGDERKTRASAPTARTVVYPKYGTIEARDNFSTLCNSWTQGQPAAPSPKEIFTSAGSALVAGWIAHGVSLRPFRQAANLRCEAVVARRNQVQVTHETNWRRWRWPGRPMEDRSRYRHDAAGATQSSVGPARATVFITAAPSAMAQIFLIPTAGGTPEQITNAELDYSGEPAWMPDGRSLVCAAQGQIFNIRLADLRVRELTDNELVNSEPLPSPDGSKIACIAADAKPQNYVVRRLWVMNADGSRARMLSGSLDRDVMHPQWSNDSRTVYFLADDHGSTHVYAGRNDGTARQVTTRAGASALVLAGR